jgi:hypothetical protein
MSCRGIQTGDPTVPEVQDGTCLKSPSVSSREEGEEESEKEIRTDRQKERKSKVVPVIFLN